MDNISTTESFFLLYALVRNADWELLPVELKDQMDYVVEQEVVAVGKWISWQESEDFKKYAENYDWLASQALSLNNCLDKLLKHLSPLPFKLGAIFQSGENLVQQLKKNYESFLAALDHLHDKQEWSIKIYKYSNANPSASAFESVTSDERVKSLQTEIQHATPGRAYLLRKQLQRVKAEVRSKESSDQINELINRIESLSEQVVRNKIIAKNITGKEEDMILNLAVLLKKEKLSAWHELHNSFEKLKECNLEVAVSGPWAAYHFVAPLIS